jgi:hypothetical protein
MRRFSLGHVNPGSMRRSRLLGHASMLQAGSPAWTDPSPRDSGSRVALHARPPTRLAVLTGCGRIQRDRARKRPGGSLRNQWRADYFVHTNVYCSFHSPVIRLSTCFSSVSLYCALCDAWAKDRSKQLHLPYAQIWIRQLGRTLRRAIRSPRRGAPGSRVCGCRGRPV